MAGIPRESLQGQAEGMVGKFNRQYRCMRTIGTWAFLPGHAPPPPEADHLRHGGGVKLTEASTRAERKGPERLQTAESKPSSSHA